MTPKVSILLPTYNGAKFLDAQLASILEQTDADFELLVVDDGSTDSTSGMIEHHANQDSRIRVVESSDRQGQQNRLRQLATLATGKFVAISDQDDVWAANRNEKLLSAVGSGAGAFGRSQLIDAAGTQTGVSLLQQLKRTPSSDVKLRALAEPMFSGHAMIVRRSQLNLAAFTSSITFDWLMALECIFSSGLTYVDDAIVYHRIHGGNQLNNIDLSPEKSRFRPAHFRELLLSKPSARLHLWIILDYLSRSNVLNADNRLMFKEAGTAAYMDWFSHWRPLTPGKSNLRNVVERSFEALAGTEADWSFFSNWIEYLTVSTASPSSLSHLRRRWKAPR